jgi:hypothetical protein
LTKLLQDLLLFLVHLGLGVLKIALETFLLALDVLIDIVFGGLAQRILTLAELVLKRIDVALLLLELFFLGLSLGTQFGSGLLAVLGGDDGLLNGNDCDLIGRRTLRLGCQCRRQNQG